MKFSSQEIGRDVYFKVIDQESNQSQYFHDELCICFVLSGSVDALIGGERFSLPEEEIMVFDRYIPYNLQLAEDSMALCMYINLAMFRYHSDLLAGKILRCCSVLGGLSETERQRFNQLKGYVVRIFTPFYKNQEESRLYIYEETMAMLRYLEKNYAIEGTQDELVHGDRMRLKRVLEYIGNNYMEAISLEQMASAEYLSTGYFSRFFSKYVGSSLTQYLKMVRLSHAHAQLCNTNDSVTAIALDNGFPNSNAFITAFREEYGTTPRGYRKDALEKHSDKKSGDADIPVSDAFRPLAKYMEDRSGLADVFTEKPNTAPYMEVDVDCSVKTKPFLQTWRNLLTVGWAKEMLMAPVQDQIRRCQEEIGFRYIRFHGLLDDEMQVYWENEVGEAVYNFTFVDLLLDFILSVGLKPYVEFSYMPKALAKEHKTRFEHSSLVTVPKDMGKWDDLITRLVRHWIGRYGLEEVMSWRYVVINGYCVFLGYFTMDEYTELYEHTYRTVKKLLPEADVGGPGCDIGMLNLRSNSDWDVFFDYCNEKECLPDFVNVQCFHGDFKETGKTVSQASATHKTPPIQISANENYLSDMLNSLRTFLKRKGIKKPRVLLETWNSTMWQRDLCNDTCFKAAFLAKNIIQNCDRLEGMGFWTLSDFMEELPVQQEIFHGGYGLFTYNGIPKSGYYALHVLHRLGEEMLDRGDNYVVTVKNNKIRISVYNYCHYDMLYQKHYMAQGDHLDRYQVFSASTDNRIRFILAGLADGNYEIETYTVSREGGSAFDAWVKMGAPKHLRPSRQEYLKSISTPVYAVQSQSSTDGSVKVELTLHPHQVTTAVISMV